MWLLLLQHLLLLMLGFLKGLLLLAAVIWRLAMMETSLKGGPPGELELVVWCGVVWCGVKVTCGSLKLSCRS
jgi:hypothetical protein